MKNNESIFFDKKTLDRIAAIICGDNLESKYCDDYGDCPFYRKGSELPGFFQNAGLECEPHDGSTRKLWTLERLKEYNENSSSIKKILLRLASPLEYGDKNATEIVIQELNNIIFAEGYEIKLNGFKPYIFNINSAIPEKDLNDDTSISEENDKENSKDKTSIKAFVSYSTKDKHVGAKIKGIFESFGIECFMAHDDIEISEEWKKRILKELSEVDIFIPLLSDNFKNSDWCSQEAGIACFRDILFIPLSLDKNINPYGFMSHRQGKVINKHNIPSNYLINPIIDNFPKISVFNNLINKLREANSFRNAEKVMSSLEPYFNKLCTDDINKVIDISIKNRQIWDASKCKGKYLPDFIKINEDKIERIKLKELSELIKLK